MSTKTIYLDTEFSEGFFKPISWLPSWLPGNKPRWSIELISIGLVDDQGNEYYAINKDYKRSRCNDWVKENVLTKLPERMIIDKDNWYDRYHGISEDVSVILIPNPLYKSIADIKADIMDFVSEEFIRKREWCDEAEHLKYLKIHLKDNPIKFKAYYADYDWVMLCTIFGTMMDLPEGFPMYCYDLKQEFDRKMDHLWRLISVMNGDFRLRYGYGENQIDKVLKSKKEMVDLLKGNVDYPKQNPADKHGALSDAVFNKSLAEYIYKL